MPQQLPFYVESVVPAHMQYDLHLKVPTLPYLQTFTAHLAAIAGIS